MTAGELRNMTIGLSWLAVWGAVLIFFDWPLLKIPLSYAWNYWMG
jgi:hypothetical protein